MESKTDNHDSNCLLGMAFSLMPKTTGRNLLFYSNGQLHDYAKDESNPEKERVACVGELFLREFLKKGNAGKEIKSILPDNELETFWNKLGENFLDVHVANVFPLDVLWDSQNEFSRVCEITARKKLKELCEDTDGFIPVYLGNQSHFIPFHYEKSEKGSGSIIDSAGNPIAVWQAPYARLFPEGKYQCIVHCDQSGLRQGNRQKNVFTGNSLMLPLYLAFLRREKKLEYNPLCLIATGEIDTAGRLKSVETAEKATGFHSCFDCNSFFVYPESTGYRAMVRNEISLPKMNLNQIEEYFRVRGLFVRTRTKPSDSVCSITPEPSSCFVGRWEELMSLNKLIDGHIPVISGEAGVGKSELAVAYAYLYAERFPQGRFMIPMQGVHSWPEAMSMMVEKWCNVYYQTTPEQLGLPKDFSKFPPDRKQKVAFRMLAARAEKGPLLLLLDNLEDLDLISDQGILDLTDSARLPNNLHMIATTRLKKTIAVQTPMEIGNLKEDDALDLFYKICKNAFPFTKYPMADGKILLDRIQEEELPAPEMIRKMEQEYAALREIICLLNRHVWSLEIVAARFAIRFQYGECDIKKEYDEIKKDLLGNLQGKKHHRSIGADAEILLKPTLEQILKQDETDEYLGQKIMHLAGFASFFPPEQVPEYALGGLWSQEFGDGKITFQRDDMLFSERAYVYAMTLLKTYRIINGNGPIFKMHRLTREVLQKRLSEEEKDDIISTMDIFLNMTLSLGVDLSFKCEDEPGSEHGVVLGDDFGDDLDDRQGDELENDSDEDWDKFLSSLPQAISVQQLQPMCGWMNDWWKESIRIMGPDFFIHNLIRECIKLNMYSEAKHLLSFDFSSVTDDKSFWAEYYEIKGSYFLNQKLFEKAEEAISKSAAFFRELLKEPDSTCGLRLVNDLRNLASIHHSRNNESDDKKAEKELREALKISRSDPDHTGAVIEVLTDMANLHCDLLQYDKAEKELDKALKLHQKNSIALSSGDKPYYPELLKTLAKHLLALQKYDDAEHVLKVALDEYDNFYYENRPEEFKPYVADTKSMLAEVHHKRGFDEDAEAELIDCLNIYREFAQNNPTVYTIHLVRTMNSLASLYQETEQTAEAEDKWLECLTICCEHVMNNPDVFSKIIMETLNNLASALVELTQYDAIESVFSGLRDVFFQLVGVDPERYDSVFANVLVSFANVHEKLGCTGDAEKERQEAADIRKKQKEDRQR